MDENVSTGQRLIYMANKLFLKEYYKKDYMIKKLIRKSKFNS